MEIKEYFLCGKENNPATCEDGLVITPYLVAIIDGVTAKGDRLWNKQKSGCFAKNILCKYLQQKGIENLNAEQLIDNLNHLLSEQIMKIEKLQIEDYPRASIIVYNNIYKEVWSYGDCQCLINHTLYSHKKKLDEIIAEIRSNYLKDAISKGMTISDFELYDPGRNAIQNSLSKQFSFENKDNDEFGYPVLNGMCLNKKMLQKYKIKEGDTVILASDGYPKVCKSLAESEKILADILQKDPMCFQKYKSTKGIKKGNISFDDRAYCKIKC